MSAVGYRDLLPGRTALACASLGWRVVPGEFANKKHPILRGWPDEATTDVERIEQWWAWEYINADVCVVTGRESGIWVLDVDPRHGGDETLRTLEAEHGALPPTFCVRTPSGGRHLYFRYPTDREVKTSTIAPGIDARGWHGQVLAPGTLGLYVPEGDPNGIAEAPGWLLDLAERRPGDPDPEIDGQRIDVDDDELVAQAGQVGGGFQEFYLFKTLSSLRGRGASAEQLESVACRIVQQFVNTRPDEPWTVEDARAKARHVAEAYPAGTRWTDLEDWQIEWTVRAALHANSAPASSSVQDEDGLLPTYHVGDIETLQLRWLVKRLWLYPSHGMVGGMEKTFKTWLLCLLAVAVASGHPFAGDRRLEVAASGPVVFFTGESGRGALKRRLRRVARALYGLTDKEFNALPIFVVDVTAPFTSPTFLGTLRLRVDDLDPVLVLVDPLYTYVRGDSDAGSVFAMGEQLRAVSAVTSEAGISLIIGHHLRKTAGDVPTLTDLTQAGAREWVESWWLASHRLPWAAESGSASLLLQVGSRHDWSATYEIGFTAGRLDPDTLAWEGGFAVSLQETEVLNVQEQQEVARATRLGQDITTVLRAIADAEHESKTSSRALERALGWDRRRIDKAVDAAIHRGLLDVHPGPRNSELRTLTESGHARLQEVDL